MTRPGTNGNPGVWLRPSSFHDWNCIREPVDFPPAAKWIQRFLCPFYRSCRADIPWTVRIEFRLVRQRSTSDGDQPVGHVPEGKGESLALDPQHDVFCLANGIQLNSFADPVTD